MSAIVTLLKRSAYNHAGRIAVASGDSEVSYQDLAMHVARMAATIGSVVPPDRPVAVHLPNSIDWVVTDLALLRLGLTSVTIPPYFTPSQIAIALCETGASCVIEQGGIRFVETDTRRRSSGIAKISYTPGSTGRPKPICLNETLLLTTANAIAARFELDQTRRHLPILPLGVLIENVAGLYATLVSGGTYLAEPSVQHDLADFTRLDFALLAARIDEHRVSSLILDPVLLCGLVRELEQNARRLEHLDFVLVGGARTSDSLVVSARAAGLSVIRSYGLTEAGSVVAIEDPKEAPSGMCGRALGHFRFGIADDGEIIVHSEDSTGLQEHPPIRTGDIGVLDPLGRVSVSGRKSNLIVTAFGRRLSPERVESELLAQPEIAQAFVHAGDGPFLSAIIVPRSAGTDPRPAVSRANRSLPRYARVGSWELGTPFSLSDGTLATTGQICRAAILRRQYELNCRVAAAHDDPSGLSPSRPSCELADRAGRGDLPSCNV